MHKPAQCDVQISAGSEKSCQVVPGQGRQARRTEYDALPDHTQQAGQLLQPHHLDKQRYSAVVLVSAIEEIILVIGSYDNDLSYCRGVDGVVIIFVSTS